MNAATRTRARPNRDRRALRLAFGLAVVAWFVLAACVVSRPGHAAPPEDAAQDVRAILVFDGGETGTGAPFVVHVPTGGVVACERFTRRIGPAVRSADCATFAPFVVVEPDRAD